MISVYSCLWRGQWLVCTEISKCTTVYKYTSTCGMISDISVQAVIHYIMTYALIWYLMMMMWWCMLWWCTLWCTYTPTLYDDDAYIMMACSRDWCFTDLFNKAISLMMNCMMMMRWVDLDDDMFRRWCLMTWQ